MSIRNRELSQFGSFIYIDDSTRSVGIATTATPYVGIGTTNATHKLTVVGNTNITGSANVTGFVTAAAFYGDGSTLDNVVAIAVDGWIYNTAGIHTLGNVGVGTTNPTSKITISGDSIVTGVSTASRFISTVTTGTSPFTVSSQTLVTNLNADYLRGKIAPSGDIVGATDSQTLTNKTISLSNNTLTGTISQFNTALSDADFATLTGTETLTNKTLTLPTISAISNSGTQTVPTGTGTLISTNSVGLVTSGMIADSSIRNEDVASDAAIAITKLASSTISGVSLGNNLNNLTAGSFINYSSGSTYNGSSAITVSVNATTANTANTVVARNASGDFTAGTITSANLNNTFIVDSKEVHSDISLVGSGSSTGTASQTLQVTGGSYISGSVGIANTNPQFTLDVNGNINFTGTLNQNGSVFVASRWTAGTGNDIYRLNGNVGVGIASPTEKLHVVGNILASGNVTGYSDETLKDNIQTIPNALEKVSQLRGVEFDRNDIEGNPHQIGVIAQEVEKIIPEVVTTHEDGIKSVAYGNLVGLLIESIKELKEEVNELRARLEEK